MNAEHLANYCSKIAKFVQDGNLQEAQEVASSLERSVLYEIAYEHPNPTELLPRTLAIVAVEMRRMIAIASQYRKSGDVSV